MYDSAAGGAEVLLRPRGPEPFGDGLEQCDELVELERLQPVVRSFCEGVGQELDPALRRTSGVGEATGGIEEATVAQTVHDVGQAGLGQVVDPAERLRRVDAHVEG